MAYSGGAQVIPMKLHTAAESIVKADLGLSLQGSGADLYGIPVPMPLIIYAFGAYITIAMAASMTGSIHLEQAPGIGGTAVDIVEWDVDTTTHLKGDGTNPLATAAVGSETFLVDDVIFAPSSAFPVIIPAPKWLTVRHVQTSSVAGEVVPFIVARWMGIDLRSTETWGNIA